MIQPFTIEDSEYSVRLRERPMIKVRRYDLLTGHVETIAEVPSYSQALAIEEEYRRGDHGTDVVTWLDPEPGQWEG